MRAEGSILLHSLRVSAAGGVTISFSFVFCVYLCCWVCHELSSFFSVVALSNDAPKLAATRPGIHVMQSYESQ